VTEPSAGSQLALAVPVPGNKIRAVTALPRSPGTGSLTQSWPPSRRHTVR
jgi:hypothetical protein